MTDAITFHKVIAGEYVAIDESGETVGRVTKTGTHLDDYPWDWYITVPSSVRWSTGASDTLRSAKEQIRYALSKRLGGEDE